MTYTIQLASIINSGCGSRMGRMILDQSTDQAHEFLLFRSTATAEEGMDLNVLDVPTRCDIGLVANEYST